MQRDLVVACLAAAALVACDDTTTGTVLDAPIGIDARLPDVHDAASDAPDGMPALLAIDVANVPFAATAVGATSAPSTLTMTNTGESETGDLAVSVIGNAAFATGGTCTGKLAAAATCSVVVTFAPTAVGIASAKVTISGAPGGSVTAVVHGTGITIGPPVLLVTRDAVPLGSVIVGGFGTAAETFTVTNIGSQPSGAIGTLQTSGADPGDFLIDDHCSTHVLAGGESCLFAMRLDPHAAGLLSAEIQVAASPGGGDTVTVAGWGLAPAQLATAFFYRDAGTVEVGGSTTVTVTLTNVGDVATVPISVTFEGDPQFAYGGGTCATAMVAPRETCTVIATLSGTTPGTYGGVLTAIGMPSAARVLVTLAGTITPAAQLAITPTSIDLASMLVGTAAPAQVFTVTNHGTVASGALATSITNAGAYAITADTCLGTSLAPGATCTISGRFKPASVGPAFARIGVVSPAAGHASASLGGVGITGPNLQLARSGVDFATVPVGAASTTSLRLTNAGGQPAPIQAVSASGPNAAEFAVTQTCSVMLAPGASCTITIRFAPTATGTRTASLSAGGATAALSGSAVAPGGLVITPSLRVLADTAIDEASTTATFVVHNTGAAGITDLAVASDPRFAATSSCLPTLAAGQSCIVTVQFKPTAAGPAIGALTATGGGGSASAALSATGLTRFELAAIDNAPASVTSYDFGTLALGAALPDDVYVTVRNNTAISWFMFIEEQFGTPPEFANLGDPCLGSIGSHRTCTYHLQFTPTSVGPKAGGVTFVMKENLGPDAWRNEVPFALAGMGVDP